MATTIVSLVATAIILAGTLMMAQGSFSAVDLLSESWKQMEGTMSEIARTDVLIESIVESPPLVEVTIRNEGQVALDDLASWDVIAQYYSGQGNYYIRWLPYNASGPGNNEWALDGIFLDAGTSAPEVFEPGILNPEEEMVIQIKLVPAAYGATANWLIVATPNGIVTSAIFP